MPGDGGAAYVFERFTLDLRRGCLCDEHGEVEIRPKAFELLSYLVRNAGRLTSKDEVMQAIWPDVIVTDESLSRCISDVRVALEDKDQRIVKTVRARGLLFTAAVALADDGAVDKSPLAQKNASQSIAQPKESEPDAPVPRQSTTADDEGPPESGDRRRHRKAFTDLALPLIDQILSVSALRASAYEGFYRSTRPYAAQPGAFIEDNILVRMAADGILRFRMVTGSVLVEGWLLPVHTQLYVIGTEFGSGGLVFAILHGVNTLKAEVLDGITLTSTFDVGRTPAAAAVVYQRIDDLSDDPKTDDERLAAMGARNPVVAASTVPENLRHHLARRVSGEDSALLVSGVLRLPLVASLSRGALKHANQQD